MTRKRERARQPQNLGRTRRGRDRPDAGVLRARCRERALDRYPRAAQAARRRTGAGAATDAICPTQADPRERATACARPRGDAIAAARARPCGDAGASACSASAASEASAATTAGTRGAHAHRDRRCATGPAARAHRVRRSGVCRVRATVCWSEPTRRSGDLVSRRRYRETPAFAPRDRRRGRRGVRVDRHLDRRELVRAVPERSRRSWSSRQRAERYGEACGGFD